MKNQIVFRPGVVPLRLDIPAAEDGRLELKCETGWKEFSLLFHVKNKQGVVQLPAEINMVIYFPKKGFFWLDDLSVKPLTSTDLKEK